MKVGSPPVVRFPSVETLAAENHSAVPLPAEDTVHVWGFSLQGNDAVIDAFSRSLSEEERMRSARFIHREHGLLYVLAHGGLRALLARYTGQDPSTLQLCASAAGKPSLVGRGGQPHAIRFNLSHSHGRMLVAVAQGHEIGVDVEQIRETVEVTKLAERFFAEAEYLDVLRCSSEEQAKQFYCYWVAKEAVLKGQGMGITSLQDCEILRADRNVLRSPVRLSPRSILIPDWSVCWLDCGAGWQGAVSASGSGWHVRIMNL